MNVILMAITAATSWQVHAYIYRSTNKSICDTRYVNWIAFTKNTYSVSTQVTRSSSTKIMLIVVVTLTVSSLYISRNTIIFCY